LITSSPRWQAASEALGAGEVQRIKIPTAKTSDLSALAQYMQNLSSGHLHDLHGANIVVNLHFTPHHETQIALNALCNALPTSALDVNTAAGLAATTAHPGTTRGIPCITIAQGAAGGAVIGGIGGASVALLLQGLKSTADVFGNPILSTLGTVLAGIAAGAVGGAIFAKTTEYSLTVGKTGVSIAAGTQNKSGKPKL
jgi:hypothetical protein